MTRWVLTALRWLERGGGDYVPLSSVDAARRAEWRKGWTDGPVWRGR
jgi:hypothetical protein